MLGPAALLSRGNALARPFAEYAFLAEYGRGIPGLGGVDPGGGCMSPELTDYVIDLRLDFVAFPLKMMQRIFQYRRIPIRFSSCHLIAVQISGVGEAGLKSEKEPSL